MGATEISCRGVGKAQFACSANFIEEVTKGVLFKTEEEHLLKTFLFDFSCQFFHFLLIFPSKTLVGGGGMPALPCLALPRLASTPILLHPCSNDHLYMFHVLSCLFSIHYTYAYVFYTIQISTGSKTQCKASGFHGVW